MNVHHKPRNQQVVVTMNVEEASEVQAILASSSPSSSAPRRWADLIADAVIDVLMAAPTQPPDGESDDQ